MSLTLGTFLLRRLKLQPWIWPTTQRFYCKVLVFQMDTSSLKKHFKRAVKDSNWQRAAEIANKLGDLLKRQGNHKGKGVFFNRGKDFYSFGTVLFPNLF
jgi:hypothetical protein